MSPNQPENDETLEALAQRLRYLPPPPVPSGLEERLLATIPSRRRASRARFWQAASILLAAAACLLCALRLPRDGIVEQPPVRTTISVPAVVAGAPTLWAYEQALRRPGADISIVLDRAGPSFTWPVAGKPPAFLSEPRTVPLN